MGSVAPSKVAKKLSDLIQGEDERKELKVLDVAAGTGRVGQQLDKIGFKNLHALGR